MRVLTLVAALCLAGCGSDPAEAPAPAPALDQEKPAPEAAPAPDEATMPEPGSPFSSVYTDLDLDACEVLEVFEEGGGASLRCDGYEGVDLFVTEGDLRFDVDAGVPNDTFSTQPGFNTLGERVEWRLRDGKPFAIVLRYNTSGPDGDQARTDLAVISVGRPGAPGCLVGWVPADASPSQNEAARAMADRDAAAGTCAA